MRIRHLYARIGVCSLNNDPLDFKRNFNNIMTSIKKCIDLNCAMRVGAELEICGYGCHDHFAQYDTINHSWDVVSDILKSKITDNIVCEVGCPVLHKAALYNSRVIIYKSKIVGIRPKMILADGGNYFETRHFASWKGKRQVGQFLLPLAIQEVTNQTTVPIGTFILDFHDTSLAYQICQQSWISNNPMIDAALDGAEIFINTSASDIQRGKLKRKLQMIEQFTERHGGNYIYVNTKGVLGDRTLFDGCCMCTQNGQVKYLTEPFNLSSVQVQVFTVNLKKIRTFRLSNKSFLKQTHNIARIPRIAIDRAIAVCQQEDVDIQGHQQNLNRIRDIYEHPHATYEPSIFLWDILRKSGGRGFFLALSGGLDSCSVALIVYNMCVLVYNNIKNDESSTEVLTELRKILREPDFIPSSVQHIVQKIFYTCYMATENSSENTRNRASKIAKTINSKHREIPFNQIYHSYQSLAKKTFGYDVKFKNQGGSRITDLALQNVQARSRMVLSYFVAMLELEQPQKEGFLLVLGSSNLDEALRGYFTKYDCSSADYNPIGSFSKNSLKQMLRWFHKILKFDVIKDILNATPTAELRPLKQGDATQNDQEDMGLTYNQLQVFGNLRKNQNLGPVSMFDRLWSQRKFKNVEELAHKIKHFFRCYSINRHKMTTITPSFHYDSESCDDNRFDMRPIMYATDWTYQFEIIDERVNEIKK